MPTTNSTALLAGDPGNWGRVCRITCNPIPVNVKQEIRRQDKQSLLELVIWTDVVTWRCVTDHQPCWLWNIRGSLAYAWRLPPFDLWDDGDGNSPRFILWWNNSWRTVYVIELFFLCSLHCAFHISLVTFPRSCGFLERWKAPEGIIPIGKVVLFENSGFYSRQITTSNGIHPVASHIPANWGRLSQE